MNKLLEMKNVGLTYYSLLGETVAVKNLNLECFEGEFLSIIGPSGCGKTTVLSLIAGLIKPTEGDIIFDGNPESEKENNLGYMLQKDHLFPWRTVEKNVYLPLEIKGQNNEKNKKYANDLLEKYGLSSFKKRYPDELSGGMRQRVALIRTLALRPKLLLLDEPFSALDYQTRLSVTDDVYKIIKNEKKTVVLVTHDISEAISMSDRIVVLSDRPAQVKMIFSPSVDGDTPLQKRESQKFGEWFEKVWRELHV